MVENDRTCVVGNDHTSCLTDDWALVRSSNGIRVGSDWEFLELSALVRRKIFLGPISDQKVVGNALQMVARHI